MSSSSSPHQEPPHPLLLHHAPIKMQKKSKIMHRKKLKVYYGVLAVVGENGNNNNTNVTKTNTPSTPDIRFSIYKTSGSSSQNTIRNQLQHQDRKSLPYETQRQMIQRFRGQMSGNLVKELLVSSMDSVEMGSSLSATSFVVLVRQQNQNQQASLLKHIFTALDTKGRKQWVDALNVALEMDRNWQRQEMQARDMQRDSATQGTVASAGTFADAAAASSHQQHPSLSEIQTADAMTDISTAAFTEEELDMAANSDDEEDDDDEITFAADFHDDRGASEADSGMNSRGGSAVRLKMGKKPMAIVLKSETVASTATDPVGSSSAELDQEGDHAHHHGTTTTNRVINWTHEAFVCLELGRRLFYNQTVQSKASLSQLLTAAHELMKKKLSSKTIESYANASPKDAGNNLPRLFAEIPKLNEYMDMPKNHQCRNRSEWVQYVKSSLDQAQSRNDSLGLLICDGASIWAVFCVDCAFTYYYVSPVDWNQHEEQTSTLKYCGTSLSGVVDELKALITTKSSVGVCSIVPILTEQEYKSLLSSRKLDQVKQSVKTHKNDISFLQLNQKDLEDKVRALREQVSEGVGSATIDKLQTQLDELQQSVTQLQQETTTMSTQQESFSSRMQSTLDQQTTEWNQKLEQMQKQLDTEISTWKSTHQKQEEQRHRVDEMENSLKNDVSNLNNRLQHELDEMKEKLKEKDQRINSLEKSLAKLTTERNSERTQTEEMQKLLVASLDEKFATLQESVRNQVDSTVQELKQSINVQQTTLSDQFLEMNVKQRLLRAQEKELHAERENVLRERFDRLLKETESTSSPTKSGTSLTQSKTPDRYSASTYSRAYGSLESSGKNQTLRLSSSSTTSSPLTPTRTTTTTPRKKFASTHFESFMKNQEDPLSKDLYIPPSPLRKEANEWISSLYGGYQPKLRGSR